MAPFIDMTAKKYPTFYCLFMAESNRIRGWAQGLLKNQSDALLINLSSFSVLDAALRYIIGMRYHVLFYNMILSICYTVKYYVYLQNTILYSLSCTPLYLFIFY